VRMALLGCNDLRTAPRCGQVHVEVACAQLCAQHSINSPREIDPALSARHLASPLADYYQVDFVFYFLAAATSHAAGDALITRFLAETGDLLIPLRHASKNRHGQISPRRTSNSPCGQIREIPK